MPPKRKLEDADLDAVESELLVDVVTGKSAEEETAVQAFEEVDVVVPVVHAPVDGVDAAAVVISLPVHPVAEHHHHAHHHHAHHHVHHHAHAPALPLDDEDEEEAEEGVVADTALGEEEVGEDDVRPSFRISVDDRRDAVLKCLDGGMTAKAVAELYDVS